MRPCVQTVCALAGEREMLRKVTSILPDNHIKTRRKRVLSCGVGSLAKKAMPLKLIEIKGGQSPLPAANVFPDSQRHPDGRL